MKPSLAFFSFAELTDSTKHHEFNEYHQLDHRPENLALPGVIFGERWVRSPDCAHVIASPQSEFSGVQYMTMYWLREPVESSRLEWMDFGTQATHLGRRPDLAWATRPLVGAFVPIKGYVHRRVLISEDALPFRPNRGIFVTATQLSGDLPAVERLARWHDRVRIPDMLDCRGVAGAWTFVSESAYPGRHRGSAESTKPGIRIHVYFLDEDPLVFARDLLEHERQWEADGRTANEIDAEVPIFTSLLRTIVPWEWDWFDVPG
jgi:hypothetical protein